MSTRTRRIGTALAAAAALATAIPAAFAAGTFTVTAGSAPPGTAVPFSGTSTGPTPQFQLTDTTANVTVTCASNTVLGSTTVGAGLSGTGVVNINASSTIWTGPCTGDGFNFSPAGSGTWILNATSGSSAGVAGTLSGMGIRLTGTGSFGTTCNFSAAGSVQASYTNATNMFDVGGDGLTISGVSGTCGALNIIKNGDAATLQVNYLISAGNPTYSPIAITQP